MRNDALRVPLTYALIGVYLLLMFVAPYVLPDKFSFDANQLTEMMELGMDGEDSYAMTAKLLAALPDYLLYPFIAAMGIFHCMLFMGGAYARRLQVAVPVLLVPLLVMGLMRPQKEVIVVIVALAALTAALRAPRPWQAVAVIGGIYAVYGLFVREYFLLILAAFMAVMVFMAARAGMRIVLVLVGLAVVMLLPPEVYLQLQGNRDAVNVYRVLGTAGNNTMFNNPYLPESAFAFLANYVYATVRLNVPILFHFTPQAFFLLGTVVLYGVFNTAAQKAGDWRARILSSLFIAHIVVLMLFEPDLGSYLRHISSVIVYLWPACMVWQAEGGTPVEGRHPMLRFIPAWFGPMEKAPLR